jgi:hypothetical protein
MTTKAYEEPCRIAINLAKNAAYASFPCYANNKEPACPHGFLDASTDPKTICRLWQRYPGRLIGLASGATSGIDVVDIDAKHDPARAWLYRYARQLPRTRAFRSRSGGVHLYFRHHKGIRCSAGKLELGVDIRADGGYIIYWFADGYECLEHSPPADWPGWLLNLLLPPPRPIQEYTSRRACNPEAGIQGLLRFIEAADDGERNSKLFWTSCRFAERISAGEITKTEAEQLLIEAARRIGLPEPEARRTIASGLQRRAA